MEKGYHLPTGESDMSVECIVFPRLVYSEREGFKLNVRAKAKLQTQSFNPR